MLLAEASASFWRIATDSEVRENMTFAIVWIVVTLGVNALTAFFIFQLSQRRHWARIALLLWTVASWMLWFIYPQRFDAYAGWGWLLTGTLVVMELLALVLLFGDRAGAWYSSRTPVTR
ncbi:hypothetical protein DBV14_02875 [Variovorax sp. KBW07]|nr:hypothetical protein DBV14_02875 [Variovorax sp. KBW07]